MEEQMRLLSLLSIFLFVSLYACGKKDSSKKQEEQTSTPSTPFVLDSEVSNTERDALITSTVVLNGLKLDGSKIQGFTDIFGGNDSAAVVNYLNERVNYILAEKTSPWSRLIVPSGALSRNLQVYASNQSVLYWYMDQYYSEMGGAKFNISNQPVEIDSSRIGAVQLGDIFVSSDAITRAITLVHEARHSDCPTGAVLSDIINFAEKGSSPQNKQCGQLHSSCLPGYSCDSFPWGAYAIDYIYSLAIYETCSNCTETQKQEALVNANQVQQSAYDIEATLDGMHGPPDMKNSTQVRDDL